MKKLAYKNDWECSIYFVDGALKTEINLCRIIGKLNITPVEYVV